MAASPQPGGDPIGVTNPLSRDHSLLRRNLLGSLLDVVGVNLRHGTDDVAVFEIGKGYARTGTEPREWWRLGFALAGAAEPAAWNRAARPYDLDDAKGVIELLAAAPGPAAARRTPPEAGEALFHPGRTARADAGRPPPRARRRAAPARRGRVGAAHDRPRHRRRGRRRRARGRPPGARSAPAPWAASPRSTATSRSWCPRPSPPRPSRRSSGSAPARCLRDVRLFDIYRGVPLAGDEKSLAFRVRFGAPDRTLTEAEVEAAVAGDRRRAGRRRGPPARLTAALWARPGRAFVPLRRAPARCYPSAGIAARPGLRSPSRGWTRGHRRVHQVAEPVRPAGRPVPVRDVRPRLHPGRDPALVGHRSRSPSRSSSRRMLSVPFGEFLAGNWTQLPARVLRTCSGS